MTVIPATPLTTPQPALARPTLRLLPTPPWPDEPHAPDRSGVIGQEPLPLTFLLPSGLPAVPQVPTDLRAPAARCWDRPLAEVDGQPTDRSALPPAGPWAARLAQAVLEVCTAGRPVGQLVRWTDPTVFQELSLRYTPRAQRPTSRRRTSLAEQVRSVHVCEPADGVAEVSVVIGGGERPRALALRIEGWRGRWVCTALDWI
ncbi:MAG TPA: Rv3235 family protein [Actinomycetes bacterium]|nr:Rv3235 family protein [Actinomycetes bacterium]